MRKHPQFDSLCGRIRAAYGELGHSMSWSFPYTPQSTLHSSQKLFFIGLNPAGKEGEHYLEERSCEEGNDYLLGDWDRKKWERGNSPLQLQVQELFKRIAASMGESVNYRAIMNESLAANYVPFRSSKWDSLGNKESTLVFVRELWSDILSFVQPSVIVCIASVAYQDLRSILEKEGFIGSEEREDIGWGKATYCLTELHKRKRTIILIRLPHLSKYKVFSRANCAVKIKAITSRIACVLKQNAF